jgi:DNA-binding transcriptional LysR family regulator
MLGVQLFDRTSRKVALTEPGRLFLEEARATLAQADHAVDVAKRAARGDFGRLAIGFNPSAAFVPVVAHAIFEFRQSFPDVRVVLSELQSGLQVAALMAGEVDIGFVRSAFPPVLPEGIVGTRILEERLHVAMRPDHPLAAKSSLAFADLDHEPMLLYAMSQKGSFAGQLLAMLRADGIEPTIVQEVGEISTLFGLVAAGLGITVLAESLCALQPAKLLYRPLRGKRALSSMWLVASRKPTAVAADFLKILEASRDAEDVAGSAVLHPGDPD